MVRTRTLRPNDRQIERARATLDQGVRAVKTWWRSVDAPKRAGRAIDLTAESAETPQPDGLSNGAADALVAYVTEELDRMRRDVDEHDVELLQALQRLAASYERIVERLESDRQERRMVAEAVLRLERRLASGEVGSGSAGELPSGERVTGGWVSPAPQPDSPPSAVEPATTIEEAIAASNEGTNGFEHTTEVIIDPVSERS
jgi:hypothetical protein